MAGQIISEFDKWWKPREDKKYRKFRSVWHETPEILEYHQTLKREKKEHRQTWKAALKSMLEQKTNIIRKELKQCNR